MIKPAPSLLFRFTKQEIAAFFKRARRALKSQYCDVLRTPKTLSYGRLLVVASRFVGPATKRNLLRRRLKALFYEELWFERDYDFVIILRAPATELSFDELKELIDPVMQGIG